MISAPYPLPLATVIMSSAAWYLEVGCAPSRIIKVSPLQISVFRVPTIFRKCQALCFHFNLVFILCVGVFVCCFNRGFWVVGKRAVGNCSCSDPLPNFYILNSQWCHILVFSGHQWREMFILPHEVPKGYNYSSYASKWEFGEYGGPFPSRRAPAHHCHSKLFENRGWSSSLG